MPHPLCQQCWRWGHTIRGCKAPQLRCSHCTGPHESESHHHACGLCKGNLKAEPPIPLTAAGQPCPHLARCSNCRERHPAMDCKCSFWRHCYDPQWINTKYAKVRVHRAHGQTISNNQNIAWWRETFFYYFYLNQKFILQCSIAVCMEVFPLPHVFHMEYGILMAYCSIL